MGEHRAGDIAGFQPPHSPNDGAVMLAGRWRVEHDGMTSEGHTAAAEVRYHARSRYAVLSLADAKQIWVNLFEDGPLPKDSAGADVQFDAKGPYVEVNAGTDVLSGSQRQLRGTPYRASTGRIGLTLHSVTYGE